MRTLALLVLVLGCAPANPEVARWEARAAKVTIVRDDWGIAHVRGPSDADAVFGMMYAQAEDDFKRVEHNYLLSLGRLAEAEGPAALYTDLRQRLFIDSTELKAQYAASPDWLKALLDGWADGLNYYLHRHPEVKPRVLTRFEPWMPLSFSEGSIGGDIERVDVAALEEFYGRADGQTGRRSAPAARPSDRPTALPPEPTGSNGIAIAPANTANGHALLLINPHTSFFFRDELQVTSDEGLNAYGAVTWGQFFIYQGFNARAGWMHTSSGVDNIDEYLLTVTEKPDGVSYTYGSEERQLSRKTVTILVRADTGMTSQSFTTYRSHYGPVVRRVDGTWVAVRLMETPARALAQSYSRTKATNYAEFRQSLDMHSNSSNNTIFADGEGNIAYFHANFIPRRDPKLDWNQPVDGANPATEWGAPMSVDSSPLVHNPPNGWLYNTNNWPYSAAGTGNSPRRADYPGYVDVELENPRGVHAMRLLEGRKDFTLDGLVAAAYSSQMPAFEPLIPALLQAYDRLPASDSLKGRLAEQVALLRGWDFRWDTGSVATTLAVHWGEALMARIQVLQGPGVDLYAELLGTPGAAKLAALADASNGLTADFGDWRTPWGSINRFQRLTDDIEHPFADAGTSIAVGFTSAHWGSLASFGARQYKGSKKRYGSYGNSFVAVVEFGDSVRARAITAGGVSGDPASKHFNDQAARYTAGDLREVYFYPSQLVGHTERTYRPGER